MVDAQQSLKGCFYIQNQFGTGNSFIELPVFFIRSEPVRIWILI